ncbi:hypothetical protein Tco_0994251 [Tanacetum coccineum]
MAGSQDDIPPPPPSPSQTPTQQNSSHYTQGQIKVLPPRTAEEILARERERKARTTLLMALPEDHLAKFHKMTDAKEMWEAIRSRFRGNDESKKMQKIHGVGVSLDANAEFLRSLPCARLKIHYSYEEQSQEWTVSALMICGPDFNVNEKVSTKRPWEESYKFDAKRRQGNQDKGVDWTSHSEEEANYDLMACNSLGSDTEVTSCSKECKESYAKLKKLYDAQREQLSDASIEIQAYTQALKKVEAQLVGYQKGQLWKEKLAEAEKMSANDKFGLGYGDYRYDGILSYENEVLQSDYPHRTFQNKGIVDSGCSRHMTGNKAYLAEYQDFNGGPVAFGGSKGYITGKGGLACLISKATINESNKCLGKIFQNDHTCVAVERKQHHGSCKAKSVKSISQPFTVLHMDLFGPTL